MESSTTETSKENDPKSHAIASSRPRHTLEEYERLFGVDEDAYEQPTTTRRELWSYYLYYNGESSGSEADLLSSLIIVEYRGQWSRARILQPSPVSTQQSTNASTFGLTPSSFQWALNGAGFQPNTNPPKPCTNSSPCVVPWAGGTRSVSSVVLIANGLCFTFMTVIFVWLGSAADYGSFGRWLLLALTVVCWVMQYGMLTIRHPSQWPTAMGLYVVSYISYGASLVFFAAIFPAISRYMPHVRKAREEDLREGKITQEEYDEIESLERNHIRYVHGN